MQKRIYLFIYKLYLDYFFVHYISIHMTAFLWDRKVHPVHPYNDLFLIKMQVFNNDSSFQCIYVPVKLLFLVFWVKWM